MSATAFQRLRREQLAKRLMMVEQPEEIEKAKNPEVHAPTYKEMQALLKEKGIKFKATAKKDELIKLLKGAE